MGIPVAYIFFDIVVNAIFGYLFLRVYHHGNDGGFSGKGNNQWLGQIINGTSSDGEDSSQEDGCFYLRLWALVTGTMLIIFAILHLLAVINCFTNNKLSRIPLLGNILDIIECSWTDIYLICMLIIWIWLIILAIMFPSIFECDQKLLMLAEIFIVYSILIAILYCFQRQKITHCVV